MPVLKDFRYSLRVLSQKPGFTLAAVIVLALGCPGRLKTPRAQRRDRSTREE